MIRVKKGDVHHAVLAVVIPQVELFGNTVGKGLLGMSARNLYEARKYVGTRTILLVWRFWTRPVYFLLTSSVFPS